MFSRVDLKQDGIQGGDFFEVPQVNWVNPRLLHRRLIRLAEEAGYEIEPEETNFSLAKEAIGDKSGVVHAQVCATRRVPGNIGFEFNPLRGLGIVAAILGAIMATAGFVVAGQILWVVAGPGLFLFAVGVAGIFWRAKASMPGHAKTRFRILLEGEVTERTVTEQGATATNLMAQISLGASTVGIHQADGTGATKSQRNGFKSFYQNQLRTTLVPFGVIPASLSPFWRRLDRETEGRWKQLHAEAHANFGTLETELAQLCGAMHDVTPASTFVPVKPAMPAAQPTAPN